MQPIKLLLGLTILCTLSWTSAFEIVGMDFVLTFNGSLLRHHSCVLDFFLVLKHKIGIISVTQDEENRSLEVKSSFCDPRILGRDATSIMKFAISVG